MNSILFSVNQLNIALSPLELLHLGQPEPLLWSLGVCRKNPCPGFLHPINTSVY